ncbi:M48 family metalloprotease [Serinicoccus sediminis]|uniref:M48 family metalloprotease n=1 Tax=Serinicoccus sediminis TaxID=2306021 RepID=UPI0010202B39|nr:M48 family metalloprotease [Serinicoccus sediminis]
MTTVLRSVVLALVLLVAQPVGPAHATHDDYGPGEVVLHDEPGSRDRVTVVFPEELSHADAEARVREHAAARELNIQDLEVVDNHGPDTVRVQVTTPVGEASGLRSTVPAAAAELWGDLSESGEVHLSLPRGATVDGAPQRQAGDLHMKGEDVTWSLPWWVAALPVLTALGLPLLVYLLLRTYARRQVSSAEDRTARVHRLRVAATVAMLAAVGGAVAGSLLGGRDGAVLLLALVAPGAPAWLGVVAGVALTLLPFVLVVVAILLAVVPADRELRDTEQTTSGAFRETGRALLVFGVLGAVVGGLGGTVMAWDARAYLVFLPVMILAIGIVGPMLTSRMMRTRQLPEPQHSMLRTWLEQHDLRVRDLRLIDTRGGKVVNAAISGVLPRLRYVFVTDHALEVLSEQELEAVIAHEAGHGKGHHLLLKAAVIALPVVAVLAAAWLGRDHLESVLEAVPLWAVLAVVCAVPPLLVLVLQGVVGIALEKRADDYAARTVGAEQLAAALETMAEANVMKRRTGWLWNLLQQHPGLEGRIERLRAAATTRAGTGS